jgi:hypothetical protein
MGLVITRDVWVLLLTHAYPGNKPDVTQFPTIADRVAHRHTALANDGGEMTAIFDTRQNSADSFALLDANGLRFIGSIPPSGCPYLLALPATDRQPVDPHRNPACLPAAVIKEIGEEDDASAASVVHVIAADEGELY